MQVPRWQHKLASKLRESPNKICRKALLKLLQDRSKPFAVVKLGACIYKETYSYSAKTPLHMRILGPLSACQNDYCEGARLVGAIYPSSGKTWVQRLTLMQFAQNLNRSCNPLTESTNMHLASPIHPVNLRIAPSATLVL